jgi:predicted O-methyltransferase YrrM
VTDATSSSSSSSSESSPQQRWTAVDGYIAEHLLPADAALDAAVADSVAAGLPPISVTPNQGKLLQLLARMQGARSILELGTLGGYSTIWLARSLLDGGQLVTLELEEFNAGVARANIERAGFGALVEIRVGPAAESLRALIDEGAKPFDFIFIDANKEGYPEYFELSLQLSRLGTVIVADNVVRDGQVVNPKSSDERVQGIRSFLQMVAGERRVEGTAVQTVGSKGYDGFALLRVVR